MNCQSSTFECDGFRNVCSFVSVVQPVEFVRESLYVKFYIYNFLESINND